MEHPSGGFAPLRSQAKCCKSDNGEQANRWTNCQRWTGDHRQQIRSGLRQCANVKGGKGGWGQQRDRLGRLARPPSPIPVPAPSPGLAADVQPCRWMEGQRVNGLHSGR